jgi:hypothetical protein
VKLKLIAAAVFAALAVAPAAGAATFAVTGGERFALPSNYNPNPGVPGVGPKTEVLRNAALSLLGKGVVTFTYIGTEAGYTNQLWLGGTRIFDNKSGPTPSATFTLAAGALDFAFRTVSPAASAANGATAGFFNSVALLQSAPGTVYAFFNDGAKVDQDYDDMVVRMDVAPVPLPAAAWLLIAGVGGLAAVARRRSPAPAA